jgi:hypothetical protein
MAVFLKEPIALDDLPTPSLLLARVQISHPPSVASMKLARISSAVGGAAGAGGVLSSVATRIMPARNASPNANAKNLFMFRLI